MNDLTIVISIIALGAAGVGYFTGRLHERDIQVKFRKANYIKKVK